MAILKSTAISLIVVAVVAVMIAVYMHDSQPINSNSYSIVPVEYVRKIAVKDFLQSFKNSKFMGDAETPLHGNGDLLESADQLMCKYLPTNADYYRIHQTVRYGSNKYIEIEKSYDLFELFSDHSHVYFIKYRAHDEK